MPTKAELEAELAELRAELEEATRTRGDKLRDKAAASAEGLRDMLKESGIDTASLDQMGPQLLDELGRLQKERPLVTLIGAFALGFVAGRALR